MHMVHVNFPVYIQQFSLFELHPVLFLRPDIIFLPQESIQIALPDGSAFTVILCKIQSTLLKVVDSRNEFHCAGETWVEIKLKCWQESKCSLGILVYFCDTKRVKALYFFCRLFNGGVIWLHNYKTFNLAVIPVINVHSATGRYFCVSFVYWLCLSTATPCSCTLFCAPVM
jgi:hypothetical protein